MVFDQISVWVPAQPGNTCHEPAGRPSSLSPHIPADPPWRPPSSGWAHCSKPVVSAPEIHVTTSGDILGCHNEGVALASSAETKDAATRPTENFPVPDDDDSTEVEKPCSKGPVDFPVSTPRSPRSSRAGRLSGYGTCHSFPAQGVCRSHSQGLMPSASSASFRLWAITAPTSR